MSYDLATAVVCYIKLDPAVIWNYQEFVESVSAVVAAASFLVTVVTDVVSVSATFAPLLVLRG